MPSLEQLTEALPPDRPQIQLFVVSSFYRDVCTDMRVALAYPSLQTYRDFFDDLQQRTEWVFEISPAKRGETVPFHAENLYAPTFDLHRLERPGPHIEIYRFPRGTREPS